MQVFSELQAVPLIGSARIQRWALTLIAYDYSILYWPVKDQANAVGLSRLTL